MNRLQKKIIWKQAKTKWLVRPRLHPIGQVFIWGRDGLGSQCITHSRLILLKTLFPLLNTKAALASCAFISCVNTLPSFLPQLQHLPGAEGKGEAAYLQRMLMGGQKEHKLVMLRSVPREATSVHRHQCKNATLTTRELARPCRGMQPGCTA